VTSAVALPRIAVVISGTGRNLQAIVDACRCGSLAAQVVLVVSNRAEAAGLMRAKAAGVPTRIVAHGDFQSREAFDGALGDALDAAAPDVVALAGFMRILTPGFVARFAGRLLNIHPSLLPKYPGLHTYRQALAAGDAEHGATVHFVTEALDGGPALLQGSVPILADDDETSLAERVMVEVEQRIYPLALSWVIGGRAQMGAQGLSFDGRPLTAPLRLDDRTS